MFDEIDNDGPRVYVNNHNTPKATVTIPTSIQRRNRRGVRRAPPRDTPFSQLHPAPFQPERHGMLSPNSLQDGAALSSPSARGLRGSEVHPQLEDVFQRVMRRLQWRSNYEEITNLPLAVQYGVADADEEWENDGAASHPHASLSATTSTVDTARRLRPPQGRRPPATSPRETHESDADDTLFLSQQPCPGTLRAVLGHVKDTVEDKLRIAESGSLKDCLRFVFESRALLDRLLKEIPSFSQFQGDGERLPTTMQLQRVYQEFRQQPVVMPGAQYARDAASGRVVTASGEVKAVHGSSEEGPPLPVSEAAELRHTASASNGAAGNQTAAPAKPAALTAIEASAATPGKAHGVLKDVPKSVELPGGLSLAIPSTYGVSSRLAHGPRGPGQPHSPLNTTSILSPTMAPATMPTTVSSPVRSNEKRNSLAGTMRSERGELMNRCDTKGGTCRSSFSSLPFERTMASAARCRATQVTSIGILTDINDTTIVSRDVYDALRAEKEHLEVEREELKLRLEEVRAELAEEHGYSSRKKKVVQYLRETLYKECSLLRSQLSQAQAQQRQLLMHGPIRDPPPLYGTSSSESTRACTFSGVPHLSENSSRLPAIVNAQRRPTGEHSVMMTSIAPTTSGGGFGERSSIFPVRRALSAQPEEREELVGSITGGISKMQVSVDVASIQSLLDLVLLAVESDQVLPPNASKGRNVNMTIMANAMQPDLETRQRDLERDFSVRQRHLKQCFVSNRVQASNLLAAKDRQIEHLKTSSDIHFLWNFWREKSVILRTELRRIRNLVAEDLKDLGRMVLNTMTSISNRARVVDTALRENHSLSATLSALRDMISSAETLFVPMLNTEYARGYHPWPLKLRNTMDPIAHMIQARYGQIQVVPVREELNSLSHIYTAIHYYVTSRQVAPQRKRPAVGPTLEFLCASLVLNPASTSDICLLVRERYHSERCFQKRIAEINMAVMALIYKQRMITELSIRALREGGMDPMLTSMPAQNTVNKVAESVRVLTAERGQLRKQRLDNAKEIYRIWTSRQIDIYEGYTPPMVGQRLVFVEEAKTRLAKASTTISVESISLPSRSPSTVTISIAGQSKAHSFWDRMLSVNEETRAGVSWENTSTMSEVDNSVAVSSEVPPTNPSGEDLTQPPGAMLDTEEKTKASEKNM